MLKRTFSHQTGGDRVCSVLALQKGIELEKSIGDTFAHCGSATPDAGSCAVREAGSRSGLVNGRENHVARHPTKPLRYSVTYGGINAFNAQTTKEKKGLSVPEVLRQRKAVHQRLIAYVKSAPEDQLGGEMRFRRRLRLDTYGHYPKHAEAIRKWRTRQL